MQVGTGFNENASIHVVCALTIFILKLKCFLAKARTFDDIAMNYT